jgi:hypothetical protein
LSGPDIGVERVLSEIVNALIDEHRGKSKTSHVAFTSFIKKLEADVNVILENIIVAEASVKEIKRRGGAHLESMVLTETEMKGGKSGGGQSAFMNMLYLKTVEQEGDLSRNRRDLRTTQWQLILYKTTMGDRKKYDTKMIGEVKSVAIKPSKKSSRHIIMVTGVVGLIISLFIAFVTEYIEESTSKRKRK